MSTLSHGPRITAAPEPAVTAHTCLAVSEQHPSLGLTIYLYVHAGALAALAICDSQTRPQWWRHFDSPESRDRFIGGYLQTRMRPSSTQPSDPTNIRIR